MSDSPRSAPQALLVALATALLYGAVGAVALMLAGPPGYASPLYPPAGIALVAVLTYGRAALPGVFLGALFVNGGLSWLRAGDTGVQWLPPVVIAAGAMLQAGVAATLLRRFIGPAPVLNAPREIALAGLLGGVLGCTISPTIATAALVWAGALSPAAALGNWLTWWSGDTLGVLIAAPLALTLVGQPAPDWRPRRRTLALPLLAATALVALAMMEAGQLHRARQSAVFEREAERLGAEAQGRLNAALHALQALHGAARAQGGLDRESLRTVSRWWLAQPIQLQATGYSVRVAADRVAAFEAETRAQGRPDYRVFDRDEGRQRAASNEVVAIRHIEPEADNAAALGVNAMSIPAAREAIARSRTSGEPAATAAFRLTQSQTDESGLVIYQALYGGEPTDAAARETRFQGVVFVTLRAERALADLSRNGVSFLQWCVVDRDPAATRQRLAGAANCLARAKASSEYRLERKLGIGGREFSLLVWADPGAVPGSQRESTWLLALSGMAAAAMLGALLLTVTGQARRTELAVHAGTEELRNEVAERIKAEAALRETSERLRSILDNVPLGVIFMDPQGHLLECNRRLCEMVGRGPAELLGQSVSGFVHADDASSIRRMRHDLLKARVTSASESIRLKVPAGEITARLSASALRGPDGRAVRLVGVVEDITEHLRLEASEHALHRAEAANRAKNEFLSRMSHELRTPLNAMIGFSQLLGLDREPGLAPHQRGWAQQIQRAGWHLLEMINETLDLSRIESGSLQLTLVPLELAPLLAACRDLVSGQAGERSVRVSESIGDAATAVLADATRLKQVLTNLLSNAVKYNREGGHVHVVVKPAAGGQVEIAVSDSGLGLTEAQIEALFQPYNRLGREGTGIEGTGIGLVISKRLTELMGGTLTVSSRAGQGSTFTLTLPAAATAGGAPALTQETTAAPYRRRLVHYVEDNETNIEVMRGVLAQREQVELHTSTLALDGLGAIRRERPDLILLDMQLPDISGLELLRHIKQDNDIADIPVIVVSADATPGQMEKALTLGAMHYVTKPLEVAAFLALVDLALEAIDTRWGM